MPHSKQVSNKSTKKPQPATSADGTGGASAQAKADARKKQHDDLEAARLRALKSQSAKAAQKATRPPSSIQFSTIAKADEPVLPAEKMTRMRSKGPDSVQQTSASGSTVSANVQVTAAQTGASTQHSTAKGTPPLGVFENCEET